MIALMTRHKNKRLGRCGMNDYERLLKLTSRHLILQSVSEQLHWDQEVMMPEGEADRRAQQLSVVAGLRHETLTNPEIGDILGRLEGLNEEQAAMAREIRWDHERAAKVPNEFAEEFAQTTSKALEVWREARENDDFASFAPWLEKIVDLNRRYAAYVDPNKDPYEVLFNEYESGLSIAEVRTFLGTIREALAPLIEAIARKEGRNTSVLEKDDVDVKIQEKFLRWLLEYVQYDFRKGRLDVSTHPFTADGGRITTRYTDGWWSAIAAALHEAGHGFYQMNLPADRFGTPFGEPRSLLVHESQSRFWENHIGRSKEFWEPIYDRVREIASLDGIDIDGFYKMINTVQPGFIRILADELTYGMHVILRFEIEQDLISGRLTVPDLPAAWNRKMQDLIGIAPATDKEGCLQDTHWACGMIGYFPTYLLGSMLSAQLDAAMMQDIPDREQMIRDGEFTAIHGWLKERIHSAGRRHTTHELVERATGKPLSADDYILYLEKKYSLLYDL